jgi:hypothetical protein
LPHLLRDQGTSAYGSFFFLHDFILLADIAIVKMIVEIMSRGRRAVEHYSFWLQQHIAAGRKPRNNPLP